MPSLRIVIFFTLAFLTLPSKAQNNSTLINAQLEQAGIEATARYAQKTNKPMPSIENYNYNMDLDIEKTIYSSQNIMHCGNLKKLISYEDQNGKLHIIRYTSKGTCHNNK
ncbi:DUF2790 domain-containing protein [Pseudomonas sp. GD03858]|uniref:DUF2790 domain-containing protein n=1 Tax=unclassified Pseudomonas TaxID=196821 RepID=UPI00244AB7B5|nr:MULTISPECIES: DUF2790 domain-containing protein [unclassified Pseudomonas]MDH0648672.1 DUF2790 domain-containing protein [Pseudomonas sp. GD03867]MDH0660787.1 DUF2790 domain-containing protein [Pseudomonas sp. GD03858]